MSAVIEVIEMEVLGCMIAMLYIISIFLAVATPWYAFTFVMWCIYRHNGGKHNYFSYLRVKGLDL